MTMALEGIKVIDCSQVAAVPIAARNLGDFGADVIHVIVNFFESQYFICTAKDEQNLYRTSTSKGLYEIPLKCGQITSWSSITFHHFTNCNTLLFTV